LSHNAKYLNDKASLGGHIFDFKKNNKVPQIVKTHKLNNVLIVRTDGWNKEFMDLYYNNVISVIGPNVKTKTVFCTGTMELPQLLINEDLTTYDIVVALGIIMQGVTDHHIVVAVTSAVGLQSISLAKNCHVVNGIVLAKTEEEILERISIEKCSILLNS
jgi:6,7-dimethyl-8-ribityllumazine synthase